MTMTDQHPITPPPELLKHWEDQHFDESENYDVMLIQAYQAGADQELEACCEWIPELTPWDAEQLRTARRPKPPSLKEQALADLDSMSIEPCLINGIDANALVRAKYDNIRRALEALND
jgi:hypothetical protein